MSATRGMISSVNRRPLPWLVAITLMVAGSLSAHELAYWLVTPDAEARARVLADTGHGYFEHLPLLLGMLAALGLAALALRAARAIRPSATGPPAWLFFLLPPLGFALQEHLERILHSGGLPLAAAIEPTFLIGLVLQLPFALAALALARALVAGAERLAVRLAHRIRTVSSRLAPVPVPTVESTRPRIGSLALGYAERGPPLLVD